MSLKRLEKTSRGHLLDVLMFAGLQAKNFEKNLTSIYKTPPDGSF